jgi:transposase
VTDSAIPPGDLGHETIGMRRRREKHERVATFLAEKPLVVGLDLGKKTHAAWLSTCDGVVIRRFKVAHSREGLTKLLAQAERDRDHSQLGRTVVFMEATSHFWENAAHFFEEQGVDYRLVATLAIARQREVEHLTFAKGDYRDAELISQLGVRGQWLRRTLEREPLWRELRGLAHEHELLLEAEIAEKLRIRSFLELVWPEFFDAFDGSSGKTALAILRKITRPLATIPTNAVDLAPRLREVAGHRLHVTKVRALAARLEAGPGFGVRHALAPTLSRLAYVVDRLEFLRDQRDDVRSRLVQLYELTPYRVFLDTVPGVSSENHALLLGLTGDPRRFDRSTCLVKLAGIEPRENQSGTWEGSHSISHRGRAPLRGALYRIVLGLRLGNAEFKRYLAHLRNREQNPLKEHPALVAAGNKYLRLLYHLCVGGKPYDPSKLGRPE